MGRRRRVPLVRGHLGSALYGDRLIFGRELGEVRAHDRSQYFGIFGIREYPAATRPGQLDALLSANYRCCITQSWAPMARADPQAWLADVLARIADMPQNRVNELLPWNRRTPTALLKAA